VRCFKTRNNKQAIIVATRAQEAEEMATQAELRAFLAALTAANDAHMQQSLAATAALTAAAAAMPAAPAAAVVVPPAAPAFSLLPGANNVAPLDFTKQQDMKVYIASTKGLEKKFNLKEDNLHLFLTEVKERVRTYGWERVVTVPDASAVPVNRNLLSNFGQVTVADCTRDARTYVGQQTRNAQNSMFLYQFLHDSLTDDAKAIMVSNVALYSINDVPAGAIFLKLLVGKASIDTKAKVLLLREQVATLYVKMGELNGNVREFNTYVDQLRTSLEGRGQTVDELIMHLFRAYEAVPDPNFRRYIENQRDRYEDGTEDISAEILMLLACNKYNLNGHRSAIPGEVTDAVVALQAKTKLVEDERARNGRARRQPKHPEWKLVEPSEGESKTKTVGTKNFHWCPYHKLWSIHTPQECRKGTPAAAAKAVPKVTKGDLKTDEKYTAMLRAAKAVFDASNKDDDQST
jgi:hypothetical protein